MTPDKRQALAHVLWIGGATDSGKSTTAEKLAERHSLQVYHYDRQDIAHHKHLAETIPAYRTFIEASLDERWVYPKPEELLQRSLQSFRDRFPMVLNDLLALPNDRWIVAEGFGLLPDLVAPLLSHSSQALWLVPTAAFKRESMTRRGKPSFGGQVSDPERAKLNLLTRDQLLTEYIQEQVLKYGYTLCEVDGSRSVDELTNLLEQHFASLLFKAARR